MRTLLSILCVLVLYKPVENSLYLAPERIQTEPGSNVTFTCFFPGLDPVISAIAWTIDDEPYQNDTDFHEATGIGTLTLTDIPVTYNMSTVQCTAEAESGNVSSNVAKLLLIDELPILEYLGLSENNAAHVFMNWTTPIYADTYCVDVVDSTSSTLETECNIRMTMYEYDLPRESWCYHYFFTVTPRNDFGQNGTEITLPYVQNVSRPMVASNISEIKPMMSYEVNMSDPVCRGEVFIKDATAFEKKIVLTGSNFNKNRLTFNTSEELESHNHPYLITVTAWNIDGRGFSNKTVFLNKPHQVNSTVQPVLIPQSASSGFSVIVILVIIVLVIILVILTLVIATMAIRKRNARLMSSEDTSVYYKYEAVNIPEKEREAVTMTEKECEAEAEDQVQEAIILENYGAEMLDDCEA